MKNKILKKILGIMGYKLIEKKLFKNDKLISTKSYLTLNRLLKNLFEEKKINFLIQIGANDGSRFDILNNYIKTYKIKSLLVEPIKEIFEKYIFCGLSCESGSQCDFFHNFSSR